MHVEFFKHNIGTKEIKDVTRVLKGIFLTIGEEVHNFERLFAEYIGCKYVLGVNSGTAALHLSLIASGIKTGDEVITTPMSFAATANSILMAGAKPVFVDVEEDTGNINADLIKKAVTERTKAIIPVHLYGQMCDMKKIHRIAHKNNLKLIEDCAHCIEGHRDNIRPGQTGNFACFSFYATKNITCGEGGAIATNSQNHARLLTKLRLHGINREPAKRYGKRYKHWDMDVLGWKYNMDNIQASLLINQLKQIENRLKKRQYIWEKYENAFKDKKGISFPKLSHPSKNALHLFTIWVNPKKRDKILWELQKQGIGVAVNYRPIHLLNYYRKRYGYRKGDFPIAEKIGAATITLPLYPRLTIAETNHVIKTVLTLSKAS